MELGSLQAYVVMVQEPWIYRGRVRGSTPAASKHVGCGRQARPRACIYTSADLDAWMLPQYSNADVVTVSINNLQGIVAKTVIFSSVYMAEENAAPPHIVEELAGYCNQNNLPLVLGCDANAHHVAWGSSNTNERGEALLEYLASTDLAWCNKGHKPTFITRNRREVLDITLASPGVFTEIKDWKVSDNPSLSDHAMITFHFTIARPTEQWYRNVRKTNWKDYKESTLPAEINKLFPLSELRSISELDSKAEELTKSIIDAYKKSCPLKKAGNKHKPNPWWNEDLTSLRRESRRLGRKAKRSNQDADWDSFIESRKALKREIRKSKRQSWRDLCERTEGLHPLARLYKILKWDSNSQLGSIEKSDGSFTNSPEETLQCMLDVHLSDPELPGPGEEVLDHNPILSELGEEIVTVEKAKYAVELFKPYKSPGGDGVYPIMLQEGWETLEPIFLLICRASLKLGHIPKIWQKAKGIFIPKPGKNSYNMAKSFRLISLTSFQLKAMERMIYWHLNSSLGVDKTITQHQHGFRTGKSTESALHQLVTKIEKTIVEGQYALGIFLDIEGAFDNVSFKAITEALSERHLPQMIVRWINAMLRSRSVTVTVQGVSVSKKVKKGSPQGGIMSPLLWNLVINSLILLINSTPADSEGFADDVNLLVRGIDIDTILDICQQCLDKIREWGLKTGLNFSPTKTEAILFTWRTKWKIKTPLKLGDKEIKFCQQVKYLGVILDSKLSWRPHCQDRVRKATIALMQCRRAIGKSWGLKPRQALWIYTAIVRPILAYAAVVWINATNSSTLVAMLRKVQRLACITITSAFPSTPTAALEVLLQIPPIDIFLKGEAYMATYRLERGDMWTRRRFVGGRGRKLKSHVDMNNEGKVNIPLLSMPKDSCTPYLQFGKRFSVKIGERSEIQSEIDELGEGIIQCYTDGSHIDKKTGAGIYFKPHEILELENQAISLGKLATVYQAEVIAIANAADVMIKADIRNQTIYILSDSQAALKALASPRVKQLIVGNCINNLNMLSQNNRVGLMWVPGHSDIEGNEQADTLAKNGAHTVCEIPEPAVPVSYCRCRLEVRYWIQKEHAKVWNQADSCLHTKGVVRTADKIPTKSLLKLSRIALCQVIQILTGHGNLARHRHKMGKVQSPLCPKCQEAEETPQHFIGDCPAYLNTRVSHFGYHKIELCDLVKQDRIFKLASFVQKTKRLEKI
jgi:ribonuclease HI